MLEWKDCIILGIGKFIFNGFCICCGEIFKWLIVIDFEGWICKGCGEEFL